MMTIGRATTDDLDDVVRILDAASTWLHERGYDQWPDGFAPPERIRPYVALGEVWIVRDYDGQVIATARMTPEADPDFWTPAEASDLALYLSKLAIDRTHAGKGLGALILRWLTDYAAQLGYRWMRLDAWRSNDELHRYYLANGWTHLRTVPAPGRNSGALFQRPAQPDVEARNSFGKLRNPPNSLIPGDRVMVAGRGPGIIFAADNPGVEYGIIPTRHDHGIMSLPGFLVDLDSGRRIRSPKEDVTPLSEPVLPGP